MTYTEAKEILDQTDKIPYPRLMNISKNPRYANLLFNRYGGSNGELSAITQYIYEHMDIENEDISKIMLSISKIEMRHLDILGGLIKKLGKDPYYINSYGKAWTSGDVQYDTGNLIETMKYNILTEQETIEGYRKAIRYTQNISIKKLLERIIIDEKAHIEIFKRIIES